MSKLFEMFDFDEMRYVEHDMDDFDDIDTINDICDIDMAIMEEALVRFVDDIVIEERSIA